MNIEESVNEGVYIYLNKIAEGLYMGKCKKGEIGHIMNHMKGEVFQLRATKSY